MKGDGAYGKFDKAFRPDTDARARILSIRLSAEEMATLREARTVDAPTVAAVIRQRLFEDHAEPRILARVKRMAAGEFG